MSKKPVPFEAVDLMGFGWAVTRGGLCIGIPEPLSQKQAIERANELNRINGIPFQYVKISCDDCFDQPLTKYQKQVCRSCRSLAAAIEFKKRNP